VPHAFLSRQAALTTGAIAAATALLTSTAVSHGPKTASLQAADASEVGGCAVFPSNNYWNANISRLPVAKHSNVWLSHMSPGSRLHPDFGPSYGEQLVAYGIPITLVSGSHVKVPVRFDYSSESDHVGYPFGSDTKIEGGRSSDGDRHAVVVDTSTCRLYETWATRTSGGRWKAGSGATWSLKSNALRPDGWTSADAAGLPILPGLLRYREVEVTGNVAHAIRFTTDITQRLHIWPARHDAGSTSNHAYPPMGARFRLKASFSLHGYRHDTVVVLRAMKKYGLVLADNGSPWYFQGSATSHWPAGLLDELKSIPARAFEAVDTRPLKVSSNSAATR
jgi:hypothetical protein